MFAFVAKREREREKKVYICCIVYLRMQRQRIARSDVKRVSGSIFRFSSVGFIKVHFLYVITVLQ